MYFNHTNYTSPTNSSQIHPHLSIPQIQVLFLNFFNNLRSPISTAAHKLQTVWPSTTVLLMCQGHILKEKLTHPCTETISDLSIAPQLGLGFVNSLPSYKKV